MTLFLRSKQLFILNTQIGSSVIEIFGKLRSAKDHDTFLITLLP